MRSQVVLAGRFEVTDTGEVYRIKKGTVKRQRFTVPVETGIMKSCPTMKTANKTMRMSIVWLPRRLYRILESCRR